MTSSDRASRLLPSPFRIRTLEVLEVRDLTPTMRRVVLGGAELEPDFPSRPFAPGEHVKVIVPDEATGELRLPTVVDGRPQMPDGPRPLFRDYTIRSFDAQRRRLALDFVVNTGGPAGNWSASARPGQRIGAGGPRGSRVYPTGYSRYVLIADETSLPSLARWIEESPAHASLTARAIVPDGGDRYPLPARDGLDARFLVSPTADETVGALLPLIDDDPDAFVWAAGESGMLGPVRARLRALGADPDRYDIDGYWKRGTAEYDHHAGTAE